MDNFKEVFTFTWKIKNFSMLPHQNEEILRSPTFVVETVNKTKWCLELYPKIGEDTPSHLSLFLMKLDLDGNDTASNINFTLVLASVCCTLDESLKAPNIAVDSEGMGYDKFISLNSLYDNNNMYLPQDVLTVR